MSWPIFFVVTCYCILASCFEFFILLSKLSSSVFVVVGYLANSRPIAFDIREATRKVPPLVARRLRGEGETGPLRKNNFFWNSYKLERKKFRWPILVCGFPNTLLYIDYIMNRSTVDPKLTCWWCRRHLVQSGANRRSSGTSRGPLESSTDSP